MAIFGNKTRRKQLVVKPAILMTTHQIQPITAATNTPVSAKKPKQSKKTNKKTVESKKVVKQPAESAPPSSSSTQLFSIDRFMAFLSLGVLVVTTVFWSWLGARTHMENADQLVDPYLFENYETFSQAIFPATHTFLIKWPLFALAALFGNSESSIVTSTVIVSLATVLGFAWLLAKLLPASRQLGLLYLAMAVVLLLVPTQPYAGALLPTSFAMLTTRNIEYLVYIGGMLLILRATKFRSWQFVAACLVFGLLFASDKLFVAFSLGAAVLLYVYTLLSRQPVARETSVRWVVASLIGLGFAQGAVLALSGAHVMEFSNASTASPYSIATPHGMLLGAVYGVLGLLTNLGANPGFDANVLSTWPSVVSRRLLSVSGATYLVPLAVIGCAVAYGVRLGVVKLRKRNGVFVQVASPRRMLAAMLVGSTVVAVGLFVLTDHYYAVDARYETIAFFAFFVLLALLLRRLRLRLRWSSLSAVVLLIACAGGMLASQARYEAEQNAMSETTGRNQLIARTLTAKPGGTLVGDYWRVVPIRAQSGLGQSIMPLQNCTAAATTLTSRSWDVKPGAPFVYLYSYDKGPTNYPTCNIQEVLAAYGQPRSVTRVAGTAAEPREVLLYFDAYPATVQAPSRQVSESHQPIYPAQVNRPKECRLGTTLVVVAHQDDDILFMSPDIIKQVQSGRCVHTVYMTAGDSGGSLLYWSSRQKGSEVAYDTMLGRTSLWQRHAVVQADGQRSTLVMPHDNPRVSLQFMNLPDGNLHGSGFPASANQSLQKLMDGSIDTIKSVDGQSVYTKPGLVRALAQIIDVFKPDMLLTQASVANETYPDHSDHIATSQLAASALASYMGQHPRYAIGHQAYVGYPIRMLDANIEPTELAQKETAFMAYAAYDGGVCQTLEDCYANTAYGYYLPRQYTAEQYQATLDSLGL